MSVIVAVLVIFWGGVVLWSNPKRQVNIVAFSLSIHVALWFVIRQFAATSSDALFWVRLAIAIGDLIPAHLRIFMHSIAFSTGGRNIGTQVIRSWVWILSGALLATIAFSNGFIPRDSIPGSNRVGPLYIVHFSGLIFLYILLLYYARKVSKRIRGIEKLELNLILLGGAFAAILVVGLRLGKRLFNIELSPHLQPLVILILFSLLCLLITTKKIFDARYILIVSIRGSLVVLLVSILVYCIGRLFHDILEAWMIAIVIAMSVVALYRPLSNYCSRILRMPPRLSDMLKAALDIAQHNLDATQLCIEFRQAIQAWSQAERVSIYNIPSAERWEKKVELKMFAPMETLLKESRWLTQERLARERQSATREYALRAFRECGIGAAVCCSGTTSCIMICIGDRPSRRPFTYPEIQTLIEISGIMEASFTRCLLAERAHEAERLATVGVVGAGVAHEIRNPLVTIKTFVQLLPERYENKEFRQKFFSLIGKEVGRIEDLTEQLLDLASPRKYTLSTQNLHVLLSESIELLRLRGKEYLVEVLSSFSAQNDTVITDANAVKQLVLNLCLNAMQAQEKQEGKRWIKIETSVTHAGVEFSVSDNGSGIKEEARGRLFQAFQTSKSSGIGLGLVICGQIVKSIGASISLDDYCFGKGATFRVVFPCPQDI